MFVKAFPEGGAEHPVSTGPGIEAVWSRDGRELFYRNDDELWVVDVETEPGFNAGTLHEFFLRHPTPRISSTTEIPTMTCRGTGSSS